MAYGEGVWRLAIVSAGADRSDADITLSKSAGARADYYSAETRNRLMLLVCKQRHDSVE